MRYRPSLSLSLVLPVVLGCEGMSDPGVDGGDAVEVTEPGHPSDALRDLLTPDETDPTGSVPDPGECLVINDCCCDCPDGSSQSWGSGGPCGTVEASWEHCLQECREHCPPTDLPDCREFPFGAVAACLDGAPNAFDAESSRSVTGDVVASGRDLTEDGCGSTDRGIRFGTGFSASDTVWFTVSDASGTPWLIEMSAPGMEPPRTGQSVTVYASTDFFSIDANGDARLAVLVRGSRSSDLSLPVSSITASDRACITFGSCLNWAGYEVLLSTHDHDSLRVPLGSSARIDSMTVTNARFVQDVATTQDPCDEPGAADVLLAFVWDQAFAD